MWQPGQRVRHRFNAELGPGMVVAATGRRLSVFFPDSGETLEIAASSDALAPLELEVGGRARVGESGQEVTIEEVEGDRARVKDGRWLPVDELWPLPAPPSPFERLRRGDLDSVEDFRNRLDAMALDRLRRRGGLGSFLGGRIRLYPHQLYAAERATRALEEERPVRFLLADEVGLGKTVEACLIMNRLLRADGGGEIDRALVVVPETLTVQWLGELWRKYHQVFVLLDDKRLADVAKDHGPGFNPFDVHRRVIVSLERLAEDRRLAEHAAEAGIDLLVVDEAHHVRRPPGHPGNPAYRALRPIADLGRHALLLTATPLEDDAHGFFRLLQLLRPDELEEGTSFETRLEGREPLPACTSATRRQDIGGLPPRLPRPVEIDDAAGWRTLARPTELLRARPAESEPARARLADRIARSLSSPACLEPLVQDDEELSDAVGKAKKADPRVAWLIERSTRWAKDGDKTLIFVAHRESLEELRRALGRVQVGIFHEDLSPERRDIEVARFRLTDGPSVLISTECGGEGRNFEFCRRLVLFDVPWHPATVEQRIGRLDRIGREIPTEIVYFRPPSGFGRVLIELYEAIGLFEKPLGGLVRELRHVSEAITERALTGAGAGAAAGEDAEEATLESFSEVLDEARRAADRVREAAYFELHRDPFRPEMADEILARVPADLDALTESVVTRAVSRFGFGCEALGGSRSWLIEFGSHALIDHLPGVAGGSRFLGTFDRELAVADESLEFFASGHALVEGVLAELEDGERGRVAFFQAPGGSDDPPFGLLALYREGAEIEALAVDARGELRPELASRLLEMGAQLAPVDAKQWTAQRTWRRAVKAMAAGLPKEKTPSAVAAFRLRTEEA
ncbi:MAG: SNF2-related protein [Acidobacteriota bacterium]